MKIVLDNIIFSLQSSGGISVYWSEILARISQEKIDLQVYQEQSAEGNLCAKNLASQLCSIQALESHWPVKLLRYWAFQKKLSRATIFHSSYYRFAPGAFNIVTIYDFIYEHYRHGLARQVHVWQKSRAIRHADAIICISEHTKKDLLHFYPNLTVPIQVIHMGKSECFYCMDKGSSYSDLLQFLSGEKFYLFIGARKHYKNFQLVLDSLNRDQYLVIVGGGELSEDEYQALQQQLGGRFYHFLHPDNQTLNQLYNMAFCLLYPSDYEGFGIPLIEAMAAGCPVVCQAVSSLQEVAMEAGVLFCKDVPAEDPQSLPSALARLDDPHYYQQLVQKGLKNAERFSWQQCYQETMAFYRTCLNSD